MIGTQQKDCSQSELPLYLQVHNQIENNGNANKI